MVKGRRKKRKATHSPKFLKTPVKHLLEAGTLEDMQHAKRSTGENLKYHWKYYAELAGQRSAVAGNINQALVQTCISYQFKNWQRAVKYKYGLHPFSTEGSLSYIGGRFNTGKSVNPEVPAFPGLYLAKDKDTALQEHLGQQINGDRAKLNLSAQERALTNPSSETIVSVSGNLDKVFDLRTHKNLNGFINQIKDFVLSKELIEMATRLGMQAPGVVKTASTLFKMLLDPHWRQVPSNFDVPANSQIFGYLICMAGIEGILYLSKFTGKECLVIFPMNFVGTNSYVALDDEVAHSKTPIKIDAINWRLCGMGAKEIIGS